MISRVGDRGQITIAKAIREELGIYAGDETVQRVEDGRIVIEVVPGGTVDRSPGRCVTRPRVGRRTSPGRPCATQLGRPRTPIAAVIGVDTSVVVRYLVGTPVAQSKRAAALIDHDAVQIGVSVVVLAECAHVLRTQYGVEQRDIIDSLIDFVQRANVTRRRRRPRRPRWDARAGAVDARPPDPRRDDRRRTRCGGRAPDRSTFDQRPACATAVATREPVPADPAAGSGPVLASAAVTTDPTAAARAQRLHPRHRGRRRRARAASRRRHALPARAQRLPPHRPRQVDLPQLRHRQRVRRPLQPPVRRHEPGQGGAGVHRRDRGGRPLARLRLGRATCSTRPTTSSSSTTGPSS